MLGGAPAATGNGAGRCPGAFSSVVRCATPSGY
jgi:hypothetical protein